MSVEAAITFAAFFLEHNNFITFNEGTFNLANHFGPFYGGRANLNGTVGIYEKNAVEFHCCALCCLVAEIMNIQELAGFGFELLSLNFYNSVHLTICILESYTAGRAHVPLITKPVTAKNPTKVRKFSEMQMADMAINQEFNCFSKKKFQEVSTAQ